MIIIHMNWAVNLNKIEYHECEWITIFIVTQIERFWKAGIIYAVISSCNVICGNTLFYFTFNQYKRDQKSAYNENFPLRSMDIL